MFLLQLAISTGWTVEYCYSLPVETIRKLQVLDDIKPYLYPKWDAYMGSIMSLIYNSKVQKKEHLRDARDFVPSIRPELPPMYEDPNFKQIQHQYTQIKDSGDTTILNSLRDEIAKEIDRLKADTENDNDYLIIRLTQLLNYS